MPAMLELRIRVCHVRGSFVCKDNVAPKISTRQLMAEPARFDYARLAHPPVTFGHEKLKTSARIPAARRYIVAHALNEQHAGSRGEAEGPEANPQVLRGGPGRRFVEQAGPPTTERHRSPGLGEGNRHRFADAGSGSRD